MLLFLDDICLPLETAEQVETALWFLKQYADRWMIEFNVQPGKSAVLALNGAYAPEKWKFGDTFVYTSTTEKYLAVKFNADGGWIQHFDSKIQAARGIFNTLRAAGLVGVTITLRYLLR